MAPSGGYGLRGRLVYPILKQQLGWLTITSRYGTPRRCKRCRPVALHPCGVSGPFFKPKVPVGFDYRSPTS